VRLRGPISQAKLCGVALLRLRALPRRLDLTKKSRPPGKRSKSQHEKQKGSDPNGRSLFQTPVKITVMQKLQNILIDMYR
jgi:hypothetical protein